MKSNVEKIESNRVVLQVEVEPGEFDKGIQQAYKKLVKQVNIPGFRKGKAPRKVLENYIGQSSILSEAADIVLPKAYFEAVKETAIEPIDQPEVEITQLEGGKPFVFKATVDVKPEVKLGEYKGLEVQKKEYKVTEEDVENYLQNLQQRYARLVNKESGVVEKGDMALIDFEGFIDGEAFPGGKGEGYTLEIGSGTFIPGFEDQLMGMAVDEEAEHEINVTFPEDYHSEELAGKEAVFKVKIKGLKVKELSPIDDEFAKDVSEFETLEELKTDVRNKLKETAENRSQSEVRSEVVNKLIEVTEVEIPKVLVERRIANYINDFANRLQQQGLNFDQYMEYSGLKLEEMKESYRTQAELGVKADLALETVAKQENIEVTEEELDQEIEKMAKAYNQEMKAFKAFLASQGNLEALKDSMTLDKAVELLLEHAKLETVSAEEAKEVEETKTEEAKTE